MTESIVEPLQDIADTTEVNTTKERPLATIQKISELYPIDGADAIECAKVLGWYVVVKKGEFKVGDLIVYVEVGAILPDRPEFEFMKTRDFRVKAVKLRGQISYGIVFPLSIMPGWADWNRTRSPYEVEKVIVDNEPFDCTITYVLEGDDVTERLNIRKYVRPVDNRGQNSQPRSFVRKDRVDNWPQFLSKTDETRIQSCYGIISNYMGKEFYWTEKLDGQSTTFYLKENDFGVCSRNFDLEPTETDPFWNTARVLQAEEKLKLAYQHEVTDYAVQGERCGPGIQGNKLKLETIQFFAFNVYDITNSRYLDREHFIKFCDRWGFPTVPVGETFTLNHTVDQLVEMVSVKSVLNRDVWCEGKVFRPIVECFERKLGRVSFKVINPLFELKFQE